MDVTQFSIITKNVWNQLNLRGFSKDKKLKFDLCQLSESLLNNNQVFVEVNCEKDIIDILRHFKLAWDVTEQEINKMIKDKKLNTFEGICLILEIQ